MSRDYELGTNVSCEESTAGPYGANCCSVCLCLLFPYFFVSVPCTRLGWRFRQLLSARILYRIVSYRMRLKGCRKREIFSSELPGIFMSEYHFLH